jgi:cytochrome P450
MDQLFAKHMHMRLLPVCEYHVPRGTAVFTSYLGAMRDPLLFPEPNNFRPDR